MPKTAKITDAPQASIIYVGAACYRVVLTVGDVHITFAPDDRAHAENLARQINDCAWVARAS